jgi:UDP-N-acetylmuramyl pentapeptide synthase
VVLLTGSFTDSGIKPEDVLLLKVSNGMNMKEISEKIQKKQ